MLTFEQKHQKLEIQEKSYAIQQITSRTLDQIVSSDYLTFGKTKPEVLKTLKELTNDLKEGITLYSASLFNSTELENFETVISGSVLYGS